MAIVSCPSCPQQLSVADENAGKKLRCPSCKTIFPFILPGAATPVIVKASPAVTPVKKSLVAKQLDEEEEEVEEVQEAVEEATPGEVKKSIKLIKSSKPHKGETYRLEWIGRELILKDHEGSKVLSISASKSSNKIKLPNSKRPNIVVKQGADDEELYFEPDEAAVEKLRKLITKTDKRKSKSGGYSSEKLQALGTVGLGILMLGGGAVTSMLSFNNAEAKGGGTYYVFTGLIGCGLIAICRGIYSLYQESKS